MFADIVATWSIISPSTGIAIFSKYAITFSTPLAIPSFSVRELSCSNALYAFLRIECASTVAVVVPSPASCTVFRAASFKSVAPMFSTGSRKNILFATVTPSFVITGLPLSFSSITLRPLAPSVELTAFVSFSIPS